MINVRMVTFGLKMDVWSVVVIWREVLMAHVRGGYVCASHMCKVGLIISIIFLNFYLILSLLLLFLLLSLLLFCY